MFEYRGYGFSGSDDAGTKSDGGAASTDEFEDEVAEEGKDGTIALGSASNIEVGSAGERDGSESSGDGDAASRRGANALPGGGASGAAGDKDENDYNDNEGSMFARMKEKFLQKRRGSNDATNNQDDKTDAQDFGGDDASSANVGKRFFYIAGGCLCVFVVAIVVGLLVTAESSGSDASDKAVPQAAPRPLSPTQPPETNATMRPSQRPSSGPTATSQPSQVPTDLPTELSPDDNILDVSVEYGVIMPSDANEGEVINELVAAMDIMATKMWEQIRNDTATTTADTTTLPVDLGNESDNLGNETILEREGDFIDTNMTADTNQTGIAGNETGEVVDGAPRTVVVVGDAKDADQSVDTTITDDIDDTDADANNMESANMFTRRRLVSWKRQARSKQKSLRITDAACVEFGSSSLCQQRQRDTKTSTNTNILNRENSEHDTNNIDMSQQHQLQITDNGRHKHNRKHKELLPSTIRNLEDGAISEVVIVSTQIVQITPSDCPRNIFITDANCTITTSTVSLNLSSIETGDERSELVGLFQVALHDGVEDGTLLDILQSEDINSSVQLFPVARLSVTAAPTLECICDVNQSDTQRFACCSQLPTMATAQPTQPTNTTSRPTLSQDPTRLPTAPPTAIPTIAPYAFDQCAPDAECCANGLDNICDLRVDEVLYVTPHNAMASRDEGFQVFPTQEVRLEAALEAGLRGLHLGVCNCGGDYVLCNDDCRLGSRDVGEVFGNIKRFLDENEREVVLILLELYVDAGEEVVLDDLYDAINGGNGGGDNDDPFMSNAYVHENASMPWPTLRDVIEADTRVLLFHYGGVSCDVSNDCPSGMHYWLEYSTNTRDRFSTIVQLLNMPSFSCQTALGGDTDAYPSSRSFFAVTNHLSTPALGNAESLNGYDLADLRLDQCSEAQDRLDVNVMLVNFWHIGDLIEFQQESNVILGPTRTSAPTATEPRTTQAPTEAPMITPTAIPTVAPYAFNQCAPDAECCANGLDNICDLRVDEVLYVTPHNAMASRDEGFQVFPTQEVRLEAALEAGLRGLHLGVCNCGGDYVLCNDDCRLGSRDVGEVFGNIKRFLDENEREVVLILLELYVDAGEEVVLDDLYDAINGGNGGNDGGGNDDPFMSNAYVHENASMPWPTLRDVIEADTRVLLFHYGGVSCDVSNDCPPGMHYWFDFGGQTNESFASVQAIFEDPASTCAVSLGEGPLQRDDAVSEQQTAFFYGVQHHLNKPRTADSIVLNALEQANRRLGQCSATYDGATVNVLIVDNWNVGDLVEVQQTYNKAAKQ